MGATSKVIQGRCTSVVLNLRNLIPRAPNSKIPFPHPTKVDTHTKPCK